MGISNVYFKEGSLLCTLSCFIDLIDERNTNVQSYEFFSLGLERNWNCGVVNEWNHRRRTGVGGRGQRRLTDVCTQTPDIGQCSMCYCIQVKKLSPFQLTDKIFVQYVAVETYIQFILKFHSFHLSLKEQRAKEKK